jgi:hypothetical protein
VLYTAQAYADKAATNSKRKQAINKLAPLVRCPHLSQFWLSASVLSDDANRLLLHKLQPQLKRLLLLKPACSTHSDCSIADILGAPASWLLPVRDIQPPSSAFVEWELDVADVRKAAQDSQHETVVLRSPTSCLSGGVRWGMELQCEWNATSKGAQLTLLHLLNSFQLAHTVAAPTPWATLEQLQCAHSRPHATSMETQQLGAGMTFSTLG